MTRRVVFLHTVTSLAGLFTDLSKELLPGDVEIIHIADELLLKVVLAQGGLSPFISQRVAGHVLAAEEAGAELVQVTCSSISPCVDTARSRVSIPVLKIDEPMIDCAVGIGSRIGVAATAQTTLGPTTELVQARAAALGRRVQVEPVLCAGAYATLFAGDRAAHDAIVIQYVTQLMERNDVVILAQASMARLAGEFPTGPGKAPVLSSPRLAVERMAVLLTQ